MSQRCSRRRHGATPGGASTFPQAFRGDVLLHSSLNLFVRVRDLQSIRKTLTGRPRGPPCGHFGGQSSPVATPGAWPPGKGCVEWKEAKGNLVLLTRVSGSLSCYSH